MASGKKPSKNKTDTLLQAQAAIQKNDFAKAESLLAAITEKNRKNREALVLLGRVQMRLGKMNRAAAQFEGALRLKPNDPGCLNALGSILFLQHQPHESETYFRSALKIAPGFAEAAGNLGLVCRHIGKHEEALERLRESVQKRGASPQVVLAFGKELIHQLQPDKARGVLSQLVKSYPDYVDAWVMLGIAFGDCGDTGKAEECWRQAEAVDLAHSGPALGRARLKQSGGDIEGAIEAVERALSLDEGDAHALFIWAHVADGNPVATLSRSRVIGMIETAQKQPGLSHEDATRLGFAAGKLLDKEKDYAAAANNYIHANELVWKAAPVDKEMYLSWHDRLLSAFSQTFFELNGDILSRGQTGDDRCGEGLTFIVGMPRSGTTLAEQILSRSVQVTPGGERPDMDRLAGVFLNQMTATHSGSLKMALDMETVRRISAQHHKSIMRLAGRDKVFTDKSPRNFMNLGLIATLFPKSKIIHCVRDPVDTCLSCYFNHFGYNAVAYSYNQEMLGFFYSLYVRMMEHWRQVLPVKFYDAVYEDIVAAPDDSIRKLTEYCQFNWDEKFLHPEESDRAVNTASLAQVKKPIYRDSVGRWAPYEPYIKPLLKAIGKQD